MNDLINLNNVSEEKRRKILEILGDGQNLESDLKGLSVRQTNYDRDNLSQRNPDDYKAIEIDGNPLFDSEFSNIKTKNNAAALYNRRITGRLTADEAETYRQLYIIHEDGFWDKVKEVVSKKKDILKSEVSDKLSLKDLGL